MFFKSLELNGFKSFATRTLVEFLPGTTVIVGPNGCGKSNVLDGIKWVLGNQSAKELRGKKMADVIFAGSSSFKPLGVAQVTLTLDNSRRVLDIDYDEVQITRRLYRTGDSEYLLNKTPCRLKDIHNLFLGTGIGTMAYSILEQGRVDKMINAKPEERRWIIEDAAGISKFKVRKIEAMRKLERTALDLKRLEDLIGEVDRQVRTLKRQAEKAERYTEYSTRLRQLEVELMVLRSTGIRNELGSLHEAAAELEARAAAARERIEALSADSEQGRSQNEEVEGKLSDGSRRLVELDTAIRDAQHAIQRNQDRLSGNKKRLEVIQAEIDQFDARGRGLTERRTDLEARRAEADRELAAAETSISEMQVEYAELKKQVDEQTRRLEELTRSVNKLREQLSHCRNVVRIEETLIARSEEERAETEVIMERLRDVIAEQNQRRIDSGRRLAELSTKIEEAKGVTARLQISHAEAHSRIEEMTRELETIRRDLHQRQARLATLQELKANFEGFLKGVREIMKASKAQTLSGVVGTVVNLIKSGREHETAIEVALGAHLQDIVVQDLAAARAALEFLSQGDRGRVTFLPVDLVRAPGAPAGLKAVLADEAALAHALDVVEADPSLGTIVRSLLEGVIIVRDYDSAERMSREHPGFTLVTPEGRLIAASGAITGGTSGASGLMGREREIRELTEAVARLDARQTELQGGLKEARGEAERLLGEVRTRTAELHSLEVDHASVRKEFEGVSRSCGESEQQLAERETQLRDLSAEIETKTRLKSEMEAEAAKHETELASSSGEMQKLQETSRARNESFISLGSRLAESRANLGKTRERLGHLTESLEAVARETAAIERDTTARTTERGRLTEENEALAAENETAAAGLAEAAANRAELAKDFETVRQEKDRIAATLRAGREELEKLQRDERVTSNDLHEKQVRQAELQGKLHNLSEQALEQFERNLEELVAETGEVDKDPREVSSEVGDLRRKLDRLGAVNLEALDEFTGQNERLQFLSGQHKDLVEAKRQIEEAIDQLDETTKKLFHETFESVRGHFVEMFRRLFNGGKADLVIDQNVDDPLLDGGIEILAQPPGKKLQSITLMSGGEKAMTAISLLFALFLHRPSPFAILDEIDAPLDDANVERFKQVVHEFNDRTQFVVITHNKLTMELADAIYGVTMEESGVSRLVSVKFDEAVEQISGEGAAVNAG